MRTNTFENLGTNITGAKTLDEALRIGGLDYEVKIASTYFKYIDEETNKEEFIEIPERKSIIRKTDRKFYEVLSNHYNPIQNRDAFGFIDYIKDDIQFEKIGETSKGMTYLITSLEPMKILGDEYKPYTISKNGFDGRSKVEIAICPLRVVCQNQFNIAFKEAPNKITIKHSPFAEVRLKEASTVLKRTVDYMKELNKQAEQWATTRISDIEIQKVINELFPIKDDMKNYQIERMENARTQFINAYKTNDNGNFRNSMWGMINAYSDYITHKEPTRRTATAEENNFIAVTFDPTLMMNFIQLVNSKIAA